MVNGIFWILRTGAPWRDLPGRYGKWKTVYDRFRTWAEDGTLERILCELRQELDLKEEIDWTQFHVDGTAVRAHRSACWHVVWVDIAVEMDMIETKALPKVLKRRTIRTISNEVQGKHMAFGLDLCNSSNQRLNSFTLNQLSYMEKCRADGWFK